MQVIADSHGNVVHLFERDCSTQRRHQKVLEEAPAPTISEAIRERITAAAVSLAKEVGYENAGTVEFLLDVDTDEVYFLEMNTRLQVEHPVTELAVHHDGQAIDLVAVQLGVALGEPLPFTQDDLVISGHAIEARVYAEDAFGGFLPQAGTATLVHWPQGVRVDAALESGQVVSTAYDPMLGKVIAHGPDRESARLALIEALDQTAILGFTTNVGFLRELAASDAFRDATIHTAWLDRLPSAARRSRHRAMRPPGAMPRTPRRCTWPPARTTGPSAVTASGSGETRHRCGSSWTAPSPSTCATVSCDGVPFDDDPAWVDVGPHQVEVVHRGQRFVFRRPDPFADAGPIAGDGALLAQMPGTVLAVNVAEGDRVAEGQTLGVLEAMKMELALKAPFDGTVTSVGAATGDQVALGALLFEVDLD